MSEAVSVREVLARERAGGSVTVRGWLRTTRHSKGLSFLELSDGSCFAGLQVVAEPALAELRERGERARHRLRGVDRRARSSIRRGRGSATSCARRASSWWAASRADYPLQKKRHSFEFLRTIAHLRPRTNTIGAVLRVRNAATQAVHQFFQERGFLCLQTPVITASDAEGAGELFRVTTIDPDQPPRDAGGRVDWGADFFGREAFLTVSGQLEAEIGALALTNVYTFGPTFRAENSNTSRHLAEFWMIEPEMAFCDLAGNMDVAEAFLKSLFRAVLERCPDDSRSSTSASTTP